MSGKVIDAEEVDVKSWPAEDEMEIGYAIAPDSAVIGGFVVLSITKIWINQQPRRGFTGETPFARELLLAIPVRKETDKEQLPENCIDSHEFRTLISNMIELLKDTKQIEESAFT